MPRSHVSGIPIAIVVAFSLGVGGMPGIRIQISTIAKNR